MALGKAVAAGLMAGAGIPLAIGVDGASRWPWLGIHLHHLADYRFLWSWPIFCMVTLAAWLLFAAARTR